MKTEQNEHTPFLYIAAWWWIFLISQKQRDLKHRKKKKKKKPLRFCIEPDFVAQGAKHRSQELAIWNQTQTAWNQTQFCHSLAERGVQLDLISLCPHFLICQTRIVTAPSYMLDCALSTWLTQELRYILVGFWSRGSNEKFARDEEWRGSNGHLWKSLWLDVRMDRHRDVWAPACPGFSSPPTLKFLLTWNAAVQWQAQVCQQAPD